MLIRNEKLRKNKILIAVILAVVLLLSGLGLVREIMLSRAQRDFEVLLEENAGRYNEGRLVLSSTSTREAQSVADTLGGRLRITANGRFALVMLPDGVTLADVAENRDLRQYMADFALDYNDFSVGTEDADVAADGDIRANFQTDEPMYPQQTYLDYINVGDSWNVSMGMKSDGEKVTVAIIDSGIDTDHPEFTDADGNSIISTMSYDATDDKTVNNDGISVIEDEHGHGTAVAGVIASQINGSGIMGIAPDVELLVIKCDMDSTGEFKSSADIVFGIYYAIEQNADVINMSFGTATPSKDLLNAIQLAVDSDIIPVAAAGNDSTAVRYYPAALDATIGVGALAQDSWELADYSNYGDNSDIMAPGSTLTAAMGGGYATENGTSMAAPVVSAAVAIYRSQHPYATFEQVKNDLLAAGKDLGELGEDMYFGFGALDMNAFICEEKGTITYDYCTEDLEATTQVFVKQHTIQTVPEPERENIIFDDWYYDKGYTRVFDYDAWYTTDFVEDVTLYAKWVNEDDEGASVYSYKTLDDGTIEITSYKGKRRYLTIPDEIDGMTVSSIGISAFAGNTRLREVILPKGLTTIREYAFDGVSRLRAVTFTGDTLQSIEKRAFQNCSSLRQFDLPDSVVTIGVETFVNCSALSTVEITPNSTLERIGEKAFAKTALSYLYLPSKVTEFDGSVLAYCRNMRSVDISSGNAAFVVQNNMVLTVDGTVLVYYPAALTGILAVPEGVITIGDYACTASSVTKAELPDSLEQICLQSFAEAKLTAVTIPANVKQIDPGAFKNCSRMMELTFTKNAQLQIIDGDSQSGGAFEGCVQLSTLELPESLVKLSENSFRGCHGISELYIPQNVSVIGKSAFENCRGLEEVAFAENCVLNKIPQFCFANCCKLNTVTFSNGIKTIDAYAFLNDYLLHTLHFGAGSILYSVGDYGFYSCTALNQMQLPETVASIGKYAYAFSGLTSVNVPANLTSIGDGAFGACYLLKRITVDADHTVYAAVDNVLFSKNITTVYCVPSSRIGSYTLPDTVRITAPCSFYYDKLLTEVILPEGLLEIQHDSFYSCSSLQCIAIPGSVTNIGRMGFYNCWSLGNVTFGENSQLQRLGLYTFVNCGMSEVTIPASVETMAQYVFSNCSNLKKITFATGSNLTYVSAYLMSGTWVEEVVFEDGSALTELQAHAFDGAKYLKSVDFGDAALETIDNYAFYNCASLQDVTIPDTVTYLGRYAFYGCAGLDRMDISAAMDYIGISAFNGTNSMKVFFVSDTLPANVQVGWDDGIAGYFLAAKEFVVTDDWEYIVTHSGSAALARYKGSAAELTIDTVDGYQVVKIGAGCFADNDTLSAVAIGAGVREIDNYAFRNSNAIVTLPEDSVLERIGNYAFSGNATESLTLPDSVTYIGTGVFEGSCLKELTISENSTLRTIGNRAFCGVSIESIFLPASLETVGVEAFKDAASLTDVTIADGETALKLSNSAFEGSSITEITIPARVNYIGEYAFGSCPNLENIHVDDDNAVYQDLDGVLLDSSGTTLIQYPSSREGAYEIPAQISVLAYASFKNAEGLTEVTFAEDSTVKTIGWQTFSGCDSLTKISVPDTVISFDFYAFENCISLTDVVLTEDSQLAGVYDGAFYGCTNLTGLSLPDAVIDIGDYAFYGCTGLTDFPLSENAQTKGIGAHAFDGCIGFTEVPTLTNLSDVGEYAFAYTSINEFTASASLKEITNNAFYGCESMLNIYCDENNENYIAIDGVLYEKGATEADDYDALVVWPYGKVLVIGEGKTEITEADTAILLKLPDVQWTTADTVTVIGSRAFEKHKLLKMVTISENITQIGTFAFMDCLSLEKIQFNAVNMDDVHGVGSIFYNSGKASDGITVIVGSQVTRIPADLFSGSSAKIIRVEFAEASICSSIGAYAFSGCADLSEISIPASVTSIERNGFSYCKALTSVTIPASVTSLERFIFTGCPQLTSAGPIGGGYNIEFEWDTSIPAYAFSDCSALTTITYPNGLTSIGESAFCFCTSLTQTAVPDGVTTIDADAFSCSGLSHITLPQTVTELGINVFYGCDGLTSAGPIGSGCNLEYEWTGQLPDYAFYGSNRLRTLTISDTITSIGQHAISDCTRMEEVYFNITAMQDLSYYDFIWNNLGADGKGVTLIIGANVTRVPDYFTNASMTIKRPNIRSVVFEEGSVCSYIGAYAFERCTNLTSINLPESITKFGMMPFNGCTGLTSMGPTGSGCDIEYAWTETIPANMFSGLTGLTKVIFSENVIPKGGSPLAGCSALKSAGPLGGGYDVEFGWTSAIPAYIFNGCTSLTKVVLPESITTIGASAFRTCTGLTQIRIPGSVTTIGNSAFSGCTGFTSAGPTGGEFDIEFGWTEAIPAYAFQGCSKLTEIAIPDSITEIGSYAFAGCSSLVDISMPGNLSAVSSNIFDGCTGLTSIVLPESVTSIGSYAFSKCSALKSVLIPENVTNIGKSAFQDCTALEEVIFNAKALDEPDSNNYFFANAGTSGNGISITIGTKVTKIPADLFYPSTYSGYAPNIVSIVFEEGSVCESIGRYAFAYCKGLTEITLPESMNTIGMYSFNGCSNLTSVVIPKCTTSIYDSAFKNCPNLAYVQIESPTIAQAITSGTSCGCLCSQADTILIPTAISSVGTYITDQFTYVESMICDGAPYTVYSKHAHDWDAGVILMEPVQCQTDGMAAYTCAICGLVKQEIVSCHALTHYAGQDPTCTAPGWEAYDICATCGYTSYVELPATGHSYEAVMIAPTCTEVGYTAHTCATCGDSYVDTYVDALGHDMGEWTTVTEATCTEDGSERRDCSRCDHYETRTIEATGHSFGAWFVNRAATCTEDGENRRNCTNCSHYETAVIPAVGHNYESVATPPTCTEQGITTHTCTVCGDSYVDNYVDALGHDMGEWTTVTEATCTEVGSERRDCSRCDHYEIRTIEATGHSFGAWFVNRAATCTENGESRRNCNNCSHYETEAIPATGHDYGSIETAPTCTEQGYTTHTCSTCGDSYVDTYVDALGHDMGEWITVTEATCTEDGSERRDCSRCDHYETRTIEATGHRFGAWFVNRAATCTENGENRRNCNNCSHYETEVIPATGHDYESVVTAPTCTEQGFTTHTCHCGDSYVDTYVDALGHDLGTWTTVTEATCTEDGSERRDCSRCDHYENRVIMATGHSFGAWFVNRAATCTEDGENRRNCNNCSHYETETIPATGHDCESVVTAPTCTEQGYTTHTCTVCGDSYVDTYVDALGHDMGEWVTVTEATCTEDGSERRDCSRCDHYETRTIEATGHSFGAWFVNRAATCMENGENRRNCNNCSYYETEAIPATGHDYGSIETAPTCTEQGYTTHTCSTCGDSYVDSYVDALGHDMGEWTTITEATCTEDGSERRDCSRCDHYETRTIEATGHSFGAWFVNRAATCTENGESRRNCNNCSHYETEVIPATGHDYESIETAPTCTEQGYNTHTCSTCGDSYVDTYVDALGHDMGEWTTITEATCTEDGSERRDCSRCDHYETRTIEAAGHSYESVVTAPTCTAQGYTTHTCSTCGDSYVDTYVDALGHDMGEWTTITEATCTEDGSERRDCSRCDHYETEVIPATGHDYEAVVTAPTCTEQGYTTHTCSECGDNYVDTFMDALGHDYEMVIEEPTCTEDGLKTEICTRCGDMVTEVLPGGHEYVDGVCIRCGDGAVTLATGWSGYTTWSLTDDGVITFSGEGAMKNYTTKDGMPWYGYADQITSVVIEEGVTSIGAYAFYGMGIESIEIADSVTTIGDYAFKSAENLDNVILPEGLTKLGESAFYGCTALTAIEIPASLWTVQPYTFKNCTALAEVTFNEGNLMKISDGAFYNTALTELVLPDCLDILDVYSFKNCADLASITIGSGLTEIREAVFYGTAIDTIEIPEGVTKIGPYAFKNCVSLEAVELPESLTSVGEASFYACTALKFVDLPDAVTTIGNYAFRKCAALETVNFGEDLVTIGESSFYGCSALTELVIPDKVTTIQGYAFKGCTALTDVTLGESVTTVGDSAFHTGTALKTLVFPASVERIGDYCFSGSYNLWKLTFEGDAPSIGSDAFKGLSATAYYPGDNATWTASIRQNYGGTITWKVN